MKCPKCKSTNVLTPVYSEDGASVAEYECKDCGHEEHLRIGATTWDYNHKKALAMQEELDSRWEKPRLKIRTLC